MVYGRYNYSTIVNGDSFMVYKPTNITVGPHPVGGGSQRSADEKSQLYKWINPYLLSHLYLEYIRIYKYSRHIPCKGVQVYYVTYVIYMPFSIANC